MMNRINHITNTQTHVAPKGSTSSIDAVWVVGPARDRLRRQFGSRQMEALETKAKTLADISPIGVGIATDKGLRPRNEDSAMVMIGQRSTEHDSAPVILAAIADGMGGHAHGDQASAIAIETLTEYMANNFFIPESELTPTGSDSKVIDEMLTEVMMQAHSAVRRGARGGGSTLSCLLIVDDMLHIAHVGDSRAYLVKAGSVDILTRDHRVVRQMEEAGILTAEEAARHPQGHILYRALGMDEDFEVDVSSRQLHSPSRLLLCTDGVWGALSANDIYMTAVQGPTPQDICEQLIRDAIVRQANDNATAVLVHMPGE